jgi:hypothetical protein
MAKDGHPFASHRNDIVERSRVGRIAHGHKHRAEGGRVHGDAAQDRKLIGKMLHDHDRKAEGKKAKHRHDRPMRAKGGRVGKNKKGATHVNVIVNGGHPSPTPVPVPMAPPPMGGPAPPPPAGLGGPAPGMGGPPMPPPGMPPRKRGGRLTSDGHTAKPMRAKGGSVKSGPAWEEGKKAGTQVQHSDGKGTTNTKANLDRGRVVTFATGGGVVSFRASGGRTEAPGPGKGMGPDLEAGSISGEARLEKAGRARSRYAKGMKETNGAR